MRWNVISHENATNYQLCTMLKNHTTFASPSASVSRSSIPKAKSNANDKTSKTFWNGI